MNLQAVGLPYEALPALSLPALDGATVYPDKPVNGTRVEGQWLVGRRQQSFAVVPNRAGKFTLPETTLTWWNVVENHAETARIPAQTFNVLPAAGSPAPAGSVSLAPQASQAPATAATGAAAAAAEGSNNVWRIIAIASLALWLLSVLAWGAWRWRRRTAHNAPSGAPADAKRDASRLRAAFLAEARGGDAAGQARALLAWARTERASLHHLGELAQAVDAGPQRDAIDALQRAHYAGIEQAGLGDRLAAAFRDGFHWQAPVAAEDASPLAPLYPFKLRR